MAEFPNYDEYIYLKIVFTLTNGADPDEMRQNAAFHLDLHYLPKYSFKDLQYTKD